MVKVYIVTAGEYSDYGIQRVFSDRTVADEYVRIKNEPSHDGYRVEEYDVDAVVPRVATTYTVYVDFDGEETYRYATSRDDEDEQPDTAEDATDRWTGFCVRGESARGYDVALKIARDKLAEIKARKAGL